MSRLRVVLLTSLLATTGAARAAEAPPPGAFYTAVTNFAAQLPATLTAQPSGKLVLATPQHRLVLAPELRAAEFDGMGLYLNGPLFRMRDGAWGITAVDISDVLMPLFGATPPRKLPPRPIVVIDPGHGGEDRGAAGSGVQEKDVVLRIARRVIAGFAGTGIEARLTREDDRYLLLSERTAFARDAGGHVLVSIHLNSSRNLQASGVETYVMPASGYPSTSNGSDGKRVHRGNLFDVESNRLAYYVHKGMLTSSGAADRGIRRARFEVLREAPCPAVLVECGFVTSLAEGPRFRDGAYLDRIAKGLVTGITTYVSRSQGVHPNRATGQSDS